MNLRNVLVSCVVASAPLFGSLACSAPIEGSGEAPVVGSAESPLMLSPTATKWPGGIVPICFSAQPSAREVVWVKDALARSWASAANIQFLYSDTCPFPGRTSYVQFNFDALDNGNWGSRGVANIGVGSPTNVNVAYCAPGNPTGCLPGGAMDADYEESFRSVVVHEVGHALGFLHEQQRPDSTPVCPLDFSDGNNARVNGILLTPNYDADSIMNYCRGWDGSRPLPYQLGYHGAENLSQGDIAGARDAYGPRQMLVSVSPAAVTARVPVRFTVFATDRLGAPFANGEVFLNGVKLGNVGQLLTATFPTKTGSVCVWVPGTCDPRCTKPHKECDVVESVVPFTLQVRATGFATTAVPLRVNL